MWSNAVPGLTFAEGSPADIEIRFVSGDHGDGNSFEDSTVKVLAHAFFPPIGKIHFNEAQRWTTDTADGTEHYKQVLDFKGKIRIKNYINNEI